MTNVPGFDVVQAPLAMTAAQTKPTRLSLSLACAIALSSAVLIPNQAKADWVSIGNRGGSSIDGYGTCTQSCQFSFIAYMFDNRGGRPNLIFNRSGASVGTLDMSADASQSWGWRNVKLQNSTTITTVNATGPFMVEFKASGSGNNSTLTTINNRAERLNLRADDGASLSVTTLKPNHCKWRLPNFKNVDIDTFNLKNGNAYQYDGVVDTLNITNGEYRQGIKDNGEVVPDTGNNGNHGSGGEITELNLQDGVFQQGKGSVTNFNQSVDKLPKQAAQSLLPISMVVASHNRVAQSRRQSLWRSFHPQWRHT